MDAQLAFTDLLGKPLRDSHLLRKLIALLPSDSHAAHTRRMVSKNAGQNSGSCR